MTVIRRLWLENFRNYPSLELSLKSGRILFTGANGQGKSNLLEAVCYLGTATSFRGAPPEALIMAGQDQAVIRAEVTSASRDILVEMDLVRGKRSRIQVNKQRVSRTSDLVGQVPNTVFGPDDLELVKGGPANRRRFLDDLLAQLHPKHAAARSDVERILKQRNALLRSSGGRLTADVESTLAVWNDKLAVAGTQLGEARRELVVKLSPVVDEIYSSLAGAGHRVELTYDPVWLAEGLAASLQSVVSDELRRGTTLVGPHRDELDVELSGLPARTQASQGEQRTLALALKVAGHRELGDALNTSPLLLLDDVFSELDPERATSLLALLVADQTMITSASPSPPVAGALQHLLVVDGVVRASGAD
ncbi:MAG: DNA replication/repair protein RecF [Acidimicrobiales bacterium]